MIDKITKITKPARGQYIKPVLEQQPRFSVVTGTSLPVQTLILKLEQGEI